jgi:hypothetical protein
VRLGGGEGSSRGLVTLTKPWLTLKTHMVELEGRWRNRVGGNGGKGVVRWGRGPQPRPPPPPSHTLPATIKTMVPWKGKCLTLSGEYKAVWYVPFCWHPRATYTSKTTKFSAPECLLPYLLKHLSISVHNPSACLARRSFLHRKTRFR